MNLLVLRFRARGHRRRSSILWMAARLGAFLVITLPPVVLGRPQAKSGTSVTNSDNSVPAAVQHVKLLLDKGTPALEIITTAPVNPQISKSDDAMRLIIDLPNTNMSVPNKLVPIKHRDLSELRLTLRTSRPPAVHVEVDFRRPLGYTWDSAGNRLVISFREIAQKDSSASATAAPSGSPVPVSAPGEAADFAHVVPVERLASGASITADAETTVLRLKRAGEVYVCPRTTVSVMHSRKGPDLMLALNGGGLETHLNLKNSADEVVTPDFRILLRGPGEFHYAIRADARGNTCVRTLPGNTASAIIYELMGDGKFEVQPQDQVVFHDGRLRPEDTTFHSESKNAAYTVLPVECGCPPPSRQTLLASNTPDAQILTRSSSPEPPTANPARSDPGSEPDPTLAKTPAAAGNAAAPDTEAQIHELPESLREQPHVQVEASLTFTPNPARLAAMRLPAVSRQMSSPVTVLPPPPAAPPQAQERHKTAFGKIKTFFSRVFR
jgi:hypothetical protein